MPYKIARQFFIVIIGAIILNWPAIINKYPFIFSDTSSHIVSASIAQVDFFRGITYSWLVLQGLFWGNLYIVAFVQALCYSLLIFWLIEHYINKHHTIIFFIIITALSLFTSASWLCGTLLPDALSGLVPLSLWLILVLPFAGNRSKLTGCGIILWYSTTVHLSHMIWILGILIALLLLQLIFIKYFKLARVRFLIILAIAGLSWLSLPVINNMYSGRFYITESTSTYLMGKIWGNGLLAKYLENNCEKKQWITCEYKGTVHGTTNQFLWPDNGPMKLNKKRWPEEKYQKWLDEFQPITRETLLQHPLEYLGMSIMDMFTLSVNIGLDNRIYFKPNISILIYINDKIPEEVERWKRSLIYQHQMPAWLFHGATWTYRILLIVSMISLLAYSWLQRSKREDLFLIALFIISYFGHALIFALLSVADPVRYQSRIGWCLIAMAMVFWAKYLVSLYADGDDIESA